MKHIPIYDPGFMPIYPAYTAWMRTADTPFFIAVERENGYTYVHRMRTDSRDFEGSYRLVERLVKALIWLAGGFRVGVSDERIAARLRADYTAGGARGFDSDFMAGVYGRPFEAVYLKDEPTAKESHKKAGGAAKGCRIGFDAGGSDRKVSAVIDGKCVYSEEVVWHPKLNADPQYHYDGIKAAMLTAAAKMPRVDAVGVSSAGIYVDNEVKVASLFLKVPKDAFDKKVRTMYIDIAKELDAPLTVANDGDVSALAGATALGDHSVLGLAFGTSEAAGYIDGQGGLNGYLSELAFVPADLNPGAMRDEWSGDLGCGVKYFSQDGVIKLAEAAGIALAQEASPAEKLKSVQALCEAGDKRAARVFADIGVYLGHTLPFYAMFYPLKHVILYGRVNSGRGGDLILEYAKKVVADEYPHLKDVNIMLPDETLRRVGQAVAAASL
ncbi:MAG: ROK family protein [Clostridiales bacterium]|jgi:predicted NBD/HSP70 family sugar kinase|nr:ROK family protein [Clostridiales bacterium]